MRPSSREASPSRSRRLAFQIWASLLVVVFGVGFFGLTSLVIAWFEDLEGIAGPVTDLGYGALFGIILTIGVLVQLRAPERKIAGVQQAVLVSPAMAVGALLAADFQAVIPALIFLVAMGILLGLHPARSEFLRRGASFSPVLLAIAVLGAVPLIGYAVEMGRQARDVAGPPHHVLRLSTMAALAVAIPLVGVLAAFKTRGWRIPAWCAGMAAVVFGVASAIFPDHPGSAGRPGGGLAIAGGVLFIAVAEWEASRANAPGGGLGRDGQSGVPAES